MKKNRMKIMVLALAFSLCLALSACGGSEQNDASAQDPAEPAASGETPENTPEEPPAEEESGFTMYYPAYMHDTEGETLVLDEKPERIVALSNAAMQIMVVCDVHPVAITSTASSVTYPDWMTELPVITTGMSETDAEGIISLEPDLVIMGSHLKEDYGEVLDGAGIPVYYTTEGPSVTYDEVKLEAIALAKSFGTEADLQTVEQAFADAEERAAGLCETMEAKDAMILFSYPPSYQQTSQGYLGSMLAMLPFNNLSDELIGAENRTAPLDMEKLVELNPEVLFAISPMSPSAEDLETSYKEEFENNPSIWDNLQATQNGNIIYLSNEFVTSKGYHIVESLNTLMDLVEARFAE